jgi:hypothetical protein
VELILALTVGIRGADNHGRGLIQAGDSRQDLFGAAHIERSGREDKVILRVDIEENRHKLDCFTT